MIIFKTLLLFITQSFAQPKLDVFSGEVVTSDKKGLYVRSCPNTKCSIIDSLKESEIYFFDKVTYGKWLAIENGFVHGDYIQNRKGLQKIGQNSYKKFEKFPHEILVYGIQKRFKTNKINYEVKNFKIKGYNFIKNNFLTQKITYVIDLIINDQVKKAEIDIQFKEGEVKSWLFKIQEGSQYSCVSNFYDSIFKTSSLNKKNKLFDQVSKKELGMVLKTPEKFLYQICHGEGQMQFFASQFGEITGVSREDINSLRAYEVKLPALDNKGSKKIKRSILKKNEIEQSDLLKYLKGKSFKVERIEDGYHSPHHYIHAFSEVDFLGVKIKRGEVVQDQALIFFKKLKDLKIGSAGEDYGISRTMYHKNRYGSIFIDLERISPSKFFTASKYFTAKVDLYDGYFAYVNHAFNNTKYPSGDEFSGKFLVKFFNLFYGEELGHDKRFYEFCDYSHRDMFKIQDVLNEFKIKNKSVQSIKRGEFFYEVLLSRDAQIKDLFLPINTKLMIYTKNCRNTAHLSYVILGGPSKYKNYELEDSDVLRFGYDGIENIFRDKSTIFSKFKKTVHKALFIENTDEIKYLLPLCYTNPNYSDFLSKDKKGIPFCYSAGYFTDGDSDKPWADQSDNKLLKISEFRVNKVSGNSFHIYTGGRSRSNLKKIDMDGLTTAVSLVKGTKEYFLPFYLHEKNDYKFLNRRKKGFRRNDSIYNIDMETKLCISTVGKKEKFEIEKYFNLFPLNSKELENIFFKNGIFSKEAFLCEPGC